MKKEEMEEGKKYKLTDEENGLVRAVKIFEKNGEKWIRFQRKEFTDIPVSDLKERIKIEILTKDKK